MMLVLLQPTDVLSAKSVNGGLYMRSKFEFDSLCALFLGFYWGVQPVLGVFSLLESTDFWFRVHIDVNNKKLLY